MQKKDSPQRQNQGRKIEKVTTGSKAALRELQKVFSEETVDKLREETGYNPRKRVATAHRLLHACIEACLCGKTLGFAPIRSFFIKRFGAIRPRAFQLRFKSTAAVAFFRAALNRLVNGIVNEFAPKLDGALSSFDDVMVYDGTGQRAPLRGRRRGLKGCTADAAGSKWVIGYSLRSGMAVAADGGAATIAELPLWRQMVPTLRRNVLYLVDLGYFCRAIYEKAVGEGSHLLLRLKADSKFRRKLRVVKAIEEGTLKALYRKHTMTSYLGRMERFGLTTVDLDVEWGLGRHALPLRVVGQRVGKKWHLYLTTIPRTRMTAETVVETYRLRWLIEFLFREWKQQVDWGRSATADKHALAALTYAALIAHALVRSLRIATALRYQVPLERVRPLACLHAVRAFASEITSALLAPTTSRWQRLSDSLFSTIFLLAFESAPSRSRPRIARNLGALGG